MSRNPRATLGNGVRSRPVTGHNSAMSDPREHVVRLFHEVAETVPAYREFLRERDIDPATIRGYDDFVRLPLLDKTNYTRRYPLPHLCRNGVLSEMIAVSSGSTGEPSFWPRSAHDERVIAARFEQIFRDAFAARERRTLAVICFALGTWVGGCSPSPVAVNSPPAGTPSPSSPRGTTRRRSCGWCRNSRRTSIRWCYWGIHRSSRT